MKGLFRQLFLLTLFFSFSLLSLFGNEQTSRSSLSAKNPVNVTLIAEPTTIQPNGSFWVAIQIELADHWHTYWKNPGEVGIPIDVSWDLPEGFHVGALQWPFPARIADDSGMVNFGYEGTVYLLTEVMVSNHIAIDTPIQIKANVSWLACRDSCVPGHTPVSLTLPVSAADPQPNPANSAIFAEARHKLPAKTAIQTQMNTGNSSLQLILPKKNADEEFLSAFFFAEGAHAINYGSEQKLTAENDKSLLNLPMHSMGNAPVDPLHGVLVLKVKKQGKEVTTSYEFSAAPVPDAARSVEKSHYAGDDEMNLSLAIGLAFIGGLILNLMPCVLPVIALKIMSFVKLSGQSRLITIKHGLSFFAGALMAFWTLAGVLLALRAYGQVVGWGFQLQSPLFVAILAFVLLIFGLSLFGLFEMGTGVSSWAGNAESKNRGLFGSFLSGVLATAVATPCTGPFLGTTVGFAVTLPSFEALLIFTSMGVGMAFPYLLFACFPALIRFLPKPGPWMVTFKELMGFVMMATVLWLLWVFGAQTSTMGLMLVLAGFLIAAVGCWIYGKWGSPVKHAIVRMLGSAIALALVAAGLWVVVNASDVPSDEPQTAAQESSLEAPKEDEWIAFSPEKVKELQAKGTPVFVDFTAKWCLICQANKLTLNAEEIVKKFSEHGVVKMRADWTKNDDVITEELRKFGRSGVPLYLLYGTDATKEPQILPQVLTAEVLSSAVELSKEMTTTHIAN